MNMNRKNKKLIINLILFITILLICFIFLEITIRLFWQEKTFEETWGYPGGLHIPDATKGYKYKPNFHGKFPGELYKNIEININSEGLRDYEHNYSSDANRIRVLGLGDSVTFGAGVRYEDTYLRQLEKRLWKEGYNIEIIKAGVNGYEFDQQYNYFFEEGYKYNPNIVIIGIILNDIQEINPQKIKENLFSENDILPDIKFFDKLKPVYKPNLDGKNNFSPKMKSFVGEYCKTCKFIYDSLINVKWKVKQKIRLWKAFDEIYFERIYKLWEGDNWKQYELKLIDLNEHLQKENIKLILVIFPYNQQFRNSLNYGKAPQNKILDTAKANNITVIDLIEYLDIPNYKDYYLVSDKVHLNAEGFKIVADLIYSELLILLKTNNTN